LPFTIAGGAGLEPGVTDVAAGVAVALAGVDALVAGVVWLGGVLLHAHVRRRAKIERAIDWLNMLV
jgi:hypothetical protein